MIASRGFLGTWYCPLFAFYMGLVYNISSVEWNPLKIKKWNGENNDNIWGQWMQCFVEPVTLIFCDISQQFDDL